MDIDSETCTVTQKTFESAITCLTTHFRWKRMPFLLLCTCTYTKTHIAAHITTKSESWSNNKYSSLTSPYRQHPIDLPGNRNHQQQKMFAASKLERSSYSKAAWFCKTSVKKEFHSLNHKVGCSEEKDPSLHYCDSINVVMYPNFDLDCFFAFGAIISGKWLSQ